MPPPDRAAETVLRSRKVVTPDGVREADVWLREGRIVRVAPWSRLAKEIPVEDVGDLAVLPGLVDSHVHVNEPGRTEWEGFETATRAAAAGGITTIVDMPLNSSPVTTTVRAFEAKLAAARGKLWVDCGFYGGVVPDNLEELEELEGLVDAGVAGFKAFLIHSGIDDFPAVGERELRRAMTVLARRSVPLLAHAEVDCGGGAPGADPRCYAGFEASRPPQWEERAVTLLTSLARILDCPVHIVHLSAAEAVAALAAGRAAGAPVTGETCPHYLTFASEEIADGDTRFKCAPPIRGRANRERLWEALADGRIDMVVSDHSPCLPALKRLETGDFPAAWGGIASLQFGLSAVWAEAAARGFTLAHVAEWMSRRPARLAGLEGRKGAIAAGCDADLVVFDADAQRRLEPVEIRHRHPVCPYTGRLLRGRVVKTYLRGELIHGGSGTAREPSGRPLLRRVPARS